MSPDTAIDPHPQVFSFRHVIGGLPCNICWHEWGRPDAERTVLCLHALNRNGRDFDFLAQALATGYRVLCLDLPGRGDSDRLANPAHYSHRTYLQVLDALLDAAGLRGRRINIVGTSLGGLLGMIYAADHPDRVERLVLNDVGTFTRGEVFHKAAQSISHEMRFRRFGQAVLTFKVMTASCGPLTDPEWQAVSRHMVEPAADGGLTLRYDSKIAIRLFEDAKADLDLWSFYDRISARVLLIRGEHSDVVSEENARAMVQGGPGAELLTIPGTGHFPMLIKQAEIDAVVSFLL